MLIAEFLSKLLFFSVGMSPDPALKHYFELRLNREWAWWICVWVIVLSFTLGGLLGDNPLLGETRPNTTSLISLLRPCCLVATESHAQLSAAALSPWRRRVPPISNDHLHCPLIDFTESGGDSALYPQSDTLQASAASVLPCPLDSPSVYCEPRTKLITTRVVLPFLIASQQVHITRDLQTMQMDLNARAFVVKFASIVKKKSNNMNSLTSFQICVNLCTFIMKSLWTTLEQCMCTACHVVIPPVCFIK